MSLLAPLFLLGAVAIVGPIIAHLVRRNTRERVYFSATHFLDPSAPHLDRRNRIEHPWLLLLRILAILTLVFGFARPFLRETPPELANHAAIRHYVVVLDESASMRRGELWSEAVERTTGIAERLGAADGFALVTAGRSATVLLGADAWARSAPGTRAALVQSVLESRAPGWGGTHLDSAVERALEELAAMRESSGVPTEAAVVIVSDLAEGSRIAGLAGRDWPDGLRVELAALDLPSEPNASLHWLGWSTAPDGRRHARVRLAHDAFDSREYRLSLHPIGGSADEVIDPLQVTLAPREARAVALEIPADHEGPVRAELAGDSEPFDNTLWIVPPERRTFSLAYWGSGDASDAQSSLFFISRAARGWREPLLEISQVPGDAASAPRAALHVVAGALSPGAIVSLREQLLAGSFALVLAQDRHLVTTAAALAGESGWNIESAPVPSNALLADLAFSDPLFTPFADPRYSDFTRIRFWRAPSLVLPDQTRAVTVARFDSGAPAVLSVPMGRGQLVVWAGDWTPIASQWVLSTKFVPWFQALAQRAVGGPTAPNMAEIGESAVLGLPATIELPGHPGIVSVDAAGTRRSIALNVPAAESRTMPLSLDAWEALGVPLSTTSRNTAAAAPPPVRAGSRIAAQLEAEQRLWRWLLLGAAGVLALESILAAALGRRAAPAPNPA